MKVFGVTGWKNTGKTGLMERLVQEITKRGYSVSTIKHAHHLVDVDQPGTDSFRHRQAGAQEVILASANRYAVMHEMRGAAEPLLPELLDRLIPVDLVLVEGYKTAAHPKLETFRKVVREMPLAHTEPSIRAVASDCSLDVEVPVFDLDDTFAIVDFVISEVGL